MATTLESAATTVDAAKVAALRAQLPATARTAYFNAGTNGPLPRVAQDALVAAASKELEVGRIVPGVYEGGWERNARVKGVLAGMVGADADELALTHSTNEGLNAVLMGIDWQRGDEVVTTQLEHPGLFAPLMLLAHRFGVIVRMADIGDGGGDVPGALEAHVGPRTRAVALSHVMWSTGAVVPLAEVGAMARRRGVLSVVDGAQGTGQVALDLHGTSIDAYAMPGQKWLCGPEATGALFLRRDRLADVKPTYLRYATYDVSGFLTPWAGAQRYEIGEFYGPAVLALEASLLWQRDEVGLDWAYARVAALGQRCRAGLAALGGVTVASPADRMAGLVCFQVAGMAPPDVTARLYEQGMTIRYVVYPPGPSVARVSCGWWNTEDEIDALVAAIGELAHAASTA